MENNIFDFKKTEYIKPMTINNKEEIVSDILNIEHSFSGRMDTPSANLFIMESVQLLVNSIALFEQGYFDCTYYSLREAIEISTTIIYLSDLTEEQRKEKMKDWKSLDRFPMQKQMLNYLSTNGAIFSDMKVKLKEYFEKVNTVSQDLNKIVHKQGFQHFYMSRNHPMTEKQYNSEQFKKAFEENLKKCIGIVAVMRLAIDPFPILLMDYEIYSRTFNSMTDPYTEDFVHKYIGKKVIEDYKTTELYVNHYDSYINEEQKNPTTLNIVKHQYIDTKNKNDIIKQLHLLNEWDYYASLITIHFDKVCKVYCGGGFQMYFTDKKTNRSALSWSGLEFKAFSDSLSKFNQSYDEAFISVLNLGQDYYLEHNEIFSKEEIDSLKTFENNIKSENQKIEEPIPEEI